MGWGPKLLSQAGEHKLNTSIYFSLLCTRNTTSHATLLPLCLSLHDPLRQEQAFYKVSHGSGENSA